MLDNDHIPEHRRVAQVLSNNQLPEAEKIQCLIDCKILNPTMTEDQRIISRLSSRINGPKMFASFARQLSAAKGYKNGIVEIIDEEEQFISDIRSHRERMPTNNAVKHVFQDFRNDGRGPNGEVFVQVLDDGKGNIQRFPNEALAGPRSVVHFAYAISKSDRDNRDSIAVKISVEDNESSRQVSDFECKVLKTLEGVPNVVRLWGQGICEVNSHKLLLLQRAPHGITDKRALSLLNINDVRNIGDQVISALQAAHNKGVYHTRINLRNLLYDQLSGGLQITGWAKSILKGADSPAKKKLATSTCPAFEDLSNEEKDGVLVAVLLLDLLGRNGVQNGHSVAEVMTEGKIDALIKAAALRFNYCVADECLRVPQSGYGHPLFTIIKNLSTCEDTLADAKHILLTWQLQSASQWTRLPVPAEFSEGHQRMKYPCELLLRPCVNEKGNTILGVGAFSVCTIPAQAIVGDYDGRDADDDFATRLKCMNLATHLLGGSRAGYMKDGRTIDNGIYDAMYYAKNAKVKKHSCPFCCITPAFL